MNQAFLIVDMLNDFVSPGAPLEVPHNREIIPALKKRLAAARSAKIPILYICDAHSPDDPEFSRMGWPPHAVQGTVGAEIVAELAPEVSDTVLCKTTYSSFYQTRLEETLRQMEIDELIVTGCVSNICIMSAVSDAALRGFKVRVPVDSVASIDPADGEFAFRQMANVYGALVER